MSKPTLQLGGGNWAAKQGKLLAFAEGDTSGKYIPRELGFSRAADIAATRVNKDGLVEKFRENQFTYSNDFRSSLHWDHAGLASYYGPNNNPSQVPDGEQGYDGSGGASFLLSSTGTSVHQFNTTTPNIAAVQTFSIYAKALGYKWLVIRTNSSTMQSYFDLENGEVGTVKSDVIEAKMVDAGNGWYRCSMTVNSDVLVSSVAFGISNGDDSYNFSASRDEGGTDRGGIYVQDAQWDRGFVATEYLDSGSSTAKAGVLDNLPRIDYTSGSARFIMEPQRVNLVTDSEGNISQMGGSATRTYKPDEVSPTGHKGGVVELSNLLGADGDRWQVVVDIADSLPSTAKKWTASMYIKGTSGEKIDYQLKRNGSGEFEGSGLDTVTFDGTWQRITSTFTNDTDNDQAGFFLAKRASTTADKVLIWGRQIEEGPNATSYIPTYGASGTRANDLVTDLDMTKLDLGTTCSVYWEGEIYGPDASYVRPITTFASHSSQSTSNRFLLFGTSFSGSTYTLTSRFNSGGSTYGVDKTGLTIGDKVKCLTVIDGTSQKFYVNGSLAGSDTIPATAVFNSLDLSNVANDINYTVDEIRFYPTAIGQAEAEALTTI